MDEYADEIHITEADDPIAFDGGEDVFFGGWGREKRKSRKSTKRSRMQKYKQKLQRLYPYAFPAIRKRDWDNPDSWLNKKSRSHTSACRRRSGRIKFYKNYGNRRLRRCHVEIGGKGNRYRKTFDLWWTVY